MELEMKRTAKQSISCGNFVGGEAGLCPDGLRRKVNLPKRQDIIYAVFTKEGTPDSFRIKSPHKEYWYPKGRKFQCSTVEDYSGQLTVGAKWKLAAAYKQGLRYVHIEY